MSAKYSYAFILKLHIVKHFFFLCCCKKPNYIIYVYIYIYIYLIRIRAIFGFPKAGLHTTSPLWRPKFGHPNTIDHCHSVWRTKTDVTPLSCSFWFDVSSKLIVRINCKKQIHTGLYTTCRIRVTIVKTSKLATSRKR